MTPVLKVLVAAGGTGGHITPGLSVAERMSQKGWTVHWIGTVGGLEAQMVPAKYRLKLINFSGVVGHGLMAKLMLPFNLLRALWQTRKVFKEVKPDLVLGMGGFPALPAGLYAWMSNIPLVIHEQNAVLGKTNEVLSARASLLLSGFPRVFGERNGKPIGKHVGNPVRESMNTVWAERQAWANRQGPLFVVVVGGSRGARALNEVMASGIALMPTAERPRILHQTGKGNQAAVVALYQALNVEAEVVEFIDDMAAVYREADLLICRSGASTVAELAVVGMPAILVPYPYHTDQQQLKNAMYLVDAGAAHVVPQAELTKERIAHDLSHLSRAQLASMSNNAKAVSKEQVAEAIVLTIQSLMQGGGQ